MGRRCSLIKQGRAAIVATTMALLAVWVAPAGASGAWAVVPSPSPAGYEAGLASVSCVSPTYCFAVGRYDNGGDARLAGKTLIERWNGRVWTIVRSPNPTHAVYSELAGVWCVSSTSCMAVGGYQLPSYLGGALAEHWNGTVWSIVRISKPGGSSGGPAVLNGVTCRTGRDCVAVGSYLVPSGSATVVEHWDGTSWSVVATPNPRGAYDVALNAVSCASPTSCFAVGEWEFLSEGSYQSLTLRWNGTAWSIMPSPNRHGSSSNLGGVSCSSSTSCLAVGVSDLDLTLKTLIERWNGTAWSIMPSPNPAKRSGLDAVGCTSSTSCVAVGSYTGAGNVDKTLVQRWNGLAWTVVTTPNPTGAANSYLLGASCVSTACVAVGEAQHGTRGLYRTLVEHSG